MNEQNIINSNNCVLLNNLTDHLTHLHYIRLRLNQIAAAISLI